MNSSSLIHNHAWAITGHLVEVVSGSLREEEQREVFAELYEIVKAGLESYQVYLQRQRSRLGTSRN